MQKNKPSETAEAMATHRAVESMRPENDRVIYDPYVKLFIGSKRQKLLNSPFRLWLMMKLLSWLKFPGVHSSIIARARFMQECIKKCFPGDFTQLVILGAGYDMNAYCFRDILSHAKVFEIDHPNTQNDKITKIKEHIKNIPENIVYVPVDFETDDLKKSVIKNGFSPSEKTLFLWEGVTYYLEKESVEQTLQFIIENSAHGSKLAFDYFPPEIVDGISKDRATKELHKVVKKLGEPYKFGIKSDEIDTFLTHHNFTTIHKSSSKDIRDTYFHGANKKRKVSHLFNFVFATT